MGIIRLKNLLSIVLLIVASVIVNAQENSKTDYTAEIEIATPKTLPQTPVSADKLTSDADDQNLKGRVKSLVREREGLTGVEKPIGKRLMEISNFNEKGNLLKQIYFEYRGRPYLVRVYGYFDKVRVSASNSVSFGNSLVTADIKKDKPKMQKNPKSDSRFDLKYEYKYKNGKLAKLQLFDNTGAKSMRYIYNYEKNQMEKLVYTEDGELNQKYLTTFDEKGNEIERIDFNIRQPKPEENDKLKYKYEFFDEKGNWTKRTITKSVIENGKEVYKPLAVEYQTISYYQ